MRTSLPVPLVYPMLYGLVLVAGVYSGSVGIGTIHLGLFLAGLAALTAVDLVEWRRFPDGAPRPLAVALLAVRLVLYLVVIAADTSGIARVLLLLLPLRVYFLFGRIAAVVAAALLLAVGVVLAQLSDPSWTTDVEQVDDLVMFSVGLALSLAMAAVAAEQLAGRERLRQAAAAAERARVGREIHDGLGHQLTAVSILLAKAAAFRDIDPDVADAAIADAREASRLALVDVRRSVRTLSETEPFDLRGALAALTVGLPVELRIDGDLDGFDDERRLVIYRAAQEAVTNALRHASPSQVVVELDVGAREAVITVTDDGSGFSADAPGWGLRGMRSRVEDVGGSLRIESARGAGTTVAVTVPRVMT